MNTPLNCWQVLQCGREPGGALAAELGVCPSATNTAYDGVNGGQSAGRFCWMIAGTFCGGTIQGTSAQKGQTCMICPFYLQVVGEQRHDLIVNPSQLRKRAER